MLARVNLAHFVLFLFMLLHVLESLVLELMHDGSGHVSSEH